MAGGRSGAELWEGVRKTFKTLGLLGRPPGTKVITQSYWPEVHHPTHKSTVGDTNVSYLDETKRKKHQVKFDGRTLVVPVVNRFEIGVLQNTAGDLIYVVDASHNFFVGIKKLSEFHHSSFLAGGPARAAGTIRLGQGFQILEVNNHSGHYKPGLLELKQAADTISLLGGDLNLIPFRLMQPPAQDIICGTGLALLAHN